MAIEITQVIRLLILTSVSFVIAFLSTPILTHFLFKYRLGKQIRIEGAPVFAQIHGKKEGTPNGGGVIIWGTVVFLAILFFILHYFFDGFWKDFNFIL